MIYKHLANIKYRDFETKIHFVGMKFLEEKRKIFNQIKITLSRQERWEVFWISGKICTKVSLREKCPYSGLFWSAFSCIWTEYGEILNAGKCGRE